MRAETSDNTIKDEHRRLDRITLTFRISQAQTLVTNPLGVVHVGDCAVCCSNAAAMKSTVGTVTAVMIDGGPLCVARPGGGFPVGGSSLSVARVLCDGNASMALRQRGQAKLKAIGITRTALTLPAGMVAWDVPAYKVADSGALTAQVGSDHLGHLLLRELDTVSGPRWDPLRREPIN